MTEQELQHFALAIAEIALVMGFIGGWAFTLLGSVMRWVLEAVDRSADKQSRIAQARWRGHWHAALREARDAGHKGRRAIAYAVDAMKTRRQANADLRSHG